MRGPHYPVIAGILFVLSTTAGLVSAGDIVFVKENIAVSVIPPDTLQVRGEYFFSSMLYAPAPARCRLYYPFPIDSAARYPHFISVYDMRSVLPVPFTRQEQGIGFAVRTAAGDTTQIVIVYRQAVKNQRGKYILTTTGAWGRPLVNSRYSVTIPNSLTLSYMSYECDSVKTIGDKTVYQFFKKQFMPDHDLSLSWTTR